ACERPGHPAKPRDRRGERPACSGSGSGRTGCRAARSARRTGRRAAPRAARPPPRRSWPPRRPPARHGACPCRTGDEYYALRWRPREGRRGRSRRLTRSSSPFPPGCMADLPPRPPFGFVRSFVPCAAIPTIRENGAKLLTARGQRRTRASAPADQGGGGEDQALAKHVAPALAGDTVDRALRRGGAERAEAGAAREQLEAEHVERVADDEGGGQPLGAHERGGGADGLGGGHALALDQDRLRRHALLLRVPPGDLALAQCIPCADAAGEDEAGGEALTVECDRVVDPRAQDGRGP